MQRLPSLFFNNLMSDLNDLNLSHYEILPHEPLHDISNNIKNLLNELVHHIPKKRRKHLATLSKSHLMGKIPKTLQIIGKLCSLLETDCKKIFLRTLLQE